MAGKNLEKHPEIIISHPGTDFDSLASMWAAHLLSPSAPVVMIAGLDSNVREFLALYGSQFPRLKLKEIDIASVIKVTIVDCSSRTQLGRIEGLLDRPNVRVVVWDHHRCEGIGFRVDEINYGEVGANTTLLVSRLIKTGIKVSPAEATLLLLGIYEDTGSLRFPATTPSDLDMASWLLRSGGSLDIVDKFLGIKLTRAQKLLMSNLGLNVRVVEVHGITIHITSAVADEFVDEIAFLVRKVQETESADVLFALVQLHDRVFIVGRSRLPSVDVGYILSIFGGGGHPQAASCLLTGTTHPIATQRLLDLVREQVRPATLASDIMSTQVWTIQNTATINDAHTLIGKKGYSGLVVTDEDRHVEGIITRSDIDRAIQHGLGHAPVKGYMVSDPVVISENASLSEIQDTIINRNAGFLPVVFGGKLSGVVTRSDVLKALHVPRVYSEAAHQSNVRETDGYGRELLSKINPNDLDILAVAGEVADSYGVPCYLVGGIVRDLVIGSNNTDVDLMVEGDGIEFAHLLAIPLNGRVIENDRFRTAKVIYVDGRSIDVATARDEFYVRPGALPEVELAGIRDDLVRRDFTINTLAIRINTHNWGEFLDYFGGLDDIHKGVIRVLHTFSFVEDPTRILRALRFAERLGFSLENQTSDLLRRALIEGRLDDVSPERIRDELLLIFDESEPWPVINRLFEEGVIGVLHQSIFSPQMEHGSVNPVIPALEWISGLDGIKENCDKSLYYLAYLIKDMDKNDAVDFTKKYKFNHEAIQLAEALDRFSIARQAASVPIELASEIARYLDNIPRPFLAALVADCADDNPRKQNVKRYLTEISGVKLEIDGKDLINAGFNPGPEFKSVLEEVRRKKLDGVVNGWDDEIKLAMSLLSASN